MNSHNDRELQSALEAFTRKLRENPHWISVEITLHTRENQIGEMTLTKSETITIDLKGGHKKESTYNHD